MSADGGEVVRHETTLGELAGLFLKLGTIGFGGPAAHIALMEEEVVQRRAWLTREQFMDYVGATNLIPGPNSTELAIAIGRERAGWPGLIVAGVSFIAPAALIVMAIAAAYVQYGNLPALLAVLAGVKPVMIAIIAQALWRLGRTVLTNAWLGFLAVGATVAAVFGTHELLVLLSAALMSVAASMTIRGRGATLAVAVVTPVAKATTALVEPVPRAATALGAAAVAPGAVSPWPLFAIFLKIGSVLFGSGYVLLAFLRADFVERLGWLTERQLLDAVAVGQVTPGPVFTTATFIGYVLAGPLGAVMATVGIFLPAFIFVALSGALVPRIRRSRVAGAALDGVNTASLALMAVVTWQLGRGVFVDVGSVIIALVAVALLATRRVNPTWLILAGAIVGVLGSDSI